MILLPVTWQKNFPQLSQHHRRHITSSHLASLLLHPPHLMLPVPLLVGIELNPEPSTSTSSSHSFVTLFRDGLELILSYLGGSEWLRAARSCRTWIIIGSSSCQKVSLHLTKFPLIQSPPQRTLLERLFQSKKSKKELAITSPWQLTSHISGFVCDKIGWYTLCSLMERRCPVLTNLNRLAITFFEANYLMLHGDMKGVDLPPTLLLPPSLTSLIIDAPVYLLGFSNFIDCADGILNAISACPLLTHLVLPMMSVCSSTGFFTQGLSCLNPCRKKLQHLVVSVQLRTWDQIAPNLDIINKLTHLTHLDLNFFLANRYGMVPEYHVLQLPQLRVLHLNTGLTSATLNIFSQNMPQLEILTNRSSFLSPDLMAWNRFKQLKSIIFNQRPHLHDDENPSGAAIGHQIASMSNLTEIVFRQWNPAPNEVELWQELAAHVGPNLTSLDFRSIWNADPLASLVSAGCGTDVILASDAALNFIRVQLQYLNIINHAAIDGVPLLTQLRRFTGLTSLTIFGATVGHDSNRRLILNEFDDVTFLPHLTRCDCVFLSSKTNINQSITIKHVDREKNVNHVHSPMNMQSPVGVHPPGSRLVGVELNPGPSMAATLFNDGLRSIQSYLDDREWINSARVSHHWFTVTSRTPPNYRSLLLNVPTLTPSLPLPLPIQKGLVTTVLSMVEGIFNNNTPVSSQNSFLAALPQLLPSNIRRMQIFSISEHNLASCAPKYPALTSLTISYFNGRDDFRIDSEAIILPALLRHISIAFITTRPQSTIEAISRLQQLESLTLRFTTVKGEVFLQWSALCSLQCLTTLHIEYTPNPAPPVDALIKALTCISTSTLTSLTLNLPNLTEKHLSLFQYPALRSLQIIDFRLVLNGISMLRRVSKSMPQLESIEGILFNLTHSTDEKVIDDDDLPLLPHLHKCQTIYLGASSTVASDGLSDIEHLCRIFNPRRLSALSLSTHRTRSILFPEWNRIATSYPWLSSITISGMSDPALYQSITTMARSPRLMAQLGDFKLFYCLFGHLERNRRRAFERLLSFPHLVTISLHGRKALSQLKDLQKVYYALWRQPVKVRHPTPPHRDHEFIIDIKRTKVPPPERLVGIELNPGPPMPSNHPALTATATAAATLFNDALMTVQSFLTDREWIVSGQVCHHWFLVASQTPLKNRSRLIEFKDLTIASQLPPLYTRTISMLKSFFGSTSNKVETEISHSGSSGKPSWCLFRTMRIESIYWHDLIKYTSRYTLESLTIEALKDLKYDFHRLVLLQQVSLRSLSITTSANIPREVHRPQYVIDSVAQLHQLESLTLRFPSCGDPQFVLDWQQLPILEHLHTLRIEFVSLNELVLRTFFSHLIRVSPTTLTSLTLGVDGINEQTFVGFHYPSLRTLRLLRLGSVLNGTIVFQQLTKSMPKLETIQSLRFFQLSSPNETKEEAEEADQQPQLLPHLQSCQIIYFARDINPSPSSTTDIDHLCRTFNPHTLTALTLQWHITRSITTADWNNIAVSYPLLESISFSRMDSPTLRSTFLTLIQSTTSLVHRMKHIGLLEWWPNLASRKNELFIVHECIMPFPNLRTFRIRGHTSKARRSTIDNIIAGHSYYNKRQPVGSVIIEMYLKVEEEEEEHDPKSFLIEITRCVKLKEEEEEPPAPRLVGIELNPGPSSATLATASASALFNDGILLIYSYLSDRDWCRSAMTCRYWFSIAKQCKRRIQVDREEEAIVYRIQSSMWTNCCMRLLCCCCCWSCSSSTNTSSVVPLPSSWQLRGPINSLTIKTVTSWNALADRLQRFADEYAHVKRLIVRKVQRDLSYYLMYSFDPPAPRSLLLPPTLTHLEIIWSREIGWMSQRCVEQLLRALGHAQHLRTLLFNILCRDEDPSIDWRPLENTASKLSLTHLTVALNHQRSVYHFYQALSHLTNLQHLDIACGSTYSEANTFTELSHLQQLRPLTQLRVLALTRDELNKEFLQCIHSQWPDLQVVSGYFRSTIPLNLELYRTFKNLQKLRFMAAPISGVENGDNSEITVIRTMCTIISLTHLSFVNWCPRESGSWTLIDSALIHLTRLSFADFIHDPLSPLATLPSLPSQLTFLEILYCPLSPTTFTSSLPRFTSLRELILREFISPIFSDAEFTPAVVHDYFDPDDSKLELLPSLERMEVSDSQLAQLSILLDYERGLNLCYWRGHDGAEVSRPMRRTKFSRVGYIAR